MITPKAGNTYIDEFGDEIKVIHIGEKLIFAEQKGDEGTLEVGKKDWTDVPEEEITVTESELIDLINTTSTVFLSQQELKATVKKHIKNKKAKK